MLDLRSLQACYRHHGDTALARVSSAIAASAGKHQQRKHLHASAAHCGHSNSAKTG